MKVSFPKAVVDVQSEKCDVRNYKEDFDQLGLGNIDTTIELIPTIDNDTCIHDYDISPKDMARMLGGMARLEIVRHEVEGCGDCIAYVELSDMQVDTPRAIRYVKEFIASAESHGWMYVEEDAAMYYKYAE